MTLHVPRLKKRGTTIRGNTVFQIYFMYKYNNYVPKG